jgi:hypothetical protein
MLNWPRADFQVRQVTFEKLITIEVSNNPIPEVDLQRSTAAQL